MRIAKLNGLNVHWREDGDPAGPAVVFAHSLGVDLRMWDRLVALMPGVRSIRYDMRGHGLTDCPEDAYWMGDLVADAAAAVEGLAGGACILVGISIGGVIAQGLAAECSDLVRGVVLMNTAAKIGTPEMWEQRVAAVRSQGVEAIAEGVLERWFPASFRAERPDEVAGWRNMLVRTPAAGYAGCAGALAETDARESTARLKLPALVVAGSEDGSTPPDLVREMAESIEGARFELIRGTGHLPPIDRPDAVVPKLLGFIDELSGTR